MRIWMRFSVKLKKTRTSSQNGNWHGIDSLDPVSALKVETYPHI